MADVEVAADAYEQPFDEADAAFWGIGFILICLLCTCLAINTPGKERTKRVVYLVAGTIVLVGWGRLTFNRMGTMSTEW
jgi:hypothetical protein